MHQWRSGLVKISVDYWLKKTAEFRIKLRDPQMAGRRPCPTKMAGGRVDSAVAGLDQISVHEWLTFVARVFRYGCPKGAGVAIMVDPSTRRLTP